MYFIQTMLPIASLKEIPEKIHTVACLMSSFWIRVLEGLSQSSSKNIFNFNLKRKTEIAMETPLPFSEINFYAFLLIVFYFCRHSIQQCNRHQVWNTSEVTKTIMKFFIRLFFLNDLAVDKVINTLYYCLDTAKPHPFIITSTKSSFQTDGIKCSVIFSPL